MRRTTRLKSATSWREHKVGDSNKVVDDKEGNDSRWKRNPRWRRNPRGKLNGERGLLVRQEKLRDLTTGR